MTAAQHAIHGKKRSFPTGFLFRVTAFLALVCGGDAQTPLLLPHWTGHFQGDREGFSYTMIGNDPSAGSSSVTIPVNIIPVRVSFSDGNVLDANDSFMGTTALDFALQSPVLQPAQWMAGSVNLGETQFGDAVQRANFWNYVSTVSPDYHVLLGQPVVQPEWLLTPGAAGTTVTESGALRGQVEMSWLRQQIEGIANTLNPNALTIFVAHQVSPAASILNTSTYDCSFHGYVSQTNPVSSATHLFVSIYDEAHCNGDVHSFSHEVAEWLNDPLVNNRVPGWSLGADEDICDTLLEVGDPLEGQTSTAHATVVKKTLNNVNYTLQETAFLSFFLRNPVSSSVNGWYTFLNSFPGFAPPCANSFAFRFERQDYPGASVAATRLLGINDSGAVVGLYSDGTRDWGFQIGSVGGASIVDPGGTASSQATALNNLGVVVGSTTDANGKVSGFMFQNDTFSTIAFPGAASTIPYGINDSNSIVGEFTDSSAIQHGFLYAKGNYTSIDSGIPNASGSWLTGIDNTGKMAGDFVTPSVNEPLAFTGIPGAFVAKVLPVWAAMPTRVVLPLNSPSEGSVTTGTYFDYAGFYHGFLLDQAGAVRIDPPAVRRASITGRTSAGTIVGYYSDSSNVQHGFVATPQPRIPARKR